MKTLIKIKKFGKKLPRGVTPAMRRFGGKTISAYPITVGVVYMHISGKRAYYFDPIHIEGVSHG